MVRVSVDVLNPKADSIYSVLKRNLGREPTNAELAAECKRILRGDPSDFTLANDPPRVRPQSFDNGEKTRQRVLVDGLNCLPGQLDLFD